MLANQTSIIQNLQDDITACVRCLMRIQNISQISEYVQPAAILSDQNTFGIFQIREHSSDNDCRFCEGLLSNIEKYCQRLRIKLKQINQQFTRIHLNIKIPLSVKLRDHMLLQKYRISQGLGKSSVSIIQVKTILKGLLVEYIKINFPGYVVQQNEGAVQVKISFANKNETAIFDLFSIELAEMNRVRYENKLQRIQSKIDPIKLEVLKSQANNSACNENLAKIRKMKLESNAILTIFQNLFSNNTETNLSHNSEIEQISIDRPSVVVSGKYKKFVRFIYQTPVQYSHKYFLNTTIKQLVERPFLNNLNSGIVGSTERVLFHGGGREDADVRMLFTGRDFAIQFLNFGFAQQNYQNILHLAEEQINQSGLISVAGLKIDHKNCLTKIKNTQDNKAKAYCCFVQCQDFIDQGTIETINQLGLIKVSQKTPIRMLHRRSLMSRHKFIYKTNAVYIDEHHMFVNILASAGTYIKEFIHGDLERTVPNLSGIAKSKCDIFQLDVIGIFEGICEETFKAFEDLSKILLLNLKSAELME